MQLTQEKTTAQKYVFDTHKLIYHLDRVRAWQQGERMVPIHLDVSPAGICNQACVYCLFAHQAARHRREKWVLGREVLMNLVTDAGRLGVRSIAFIGDGEPFANPHTPEALQLGRAVGVDCSTATNGVLLRQEYLPAVLRSLTWMRFSLCAGEPELYQAIQGARPGDFEKVLANMAACARIKRQEGLDIDIGAVFLLLPENRHQLLEAVEQVRQTGLDYLYIKQYVAYEKNEYQFDFSFYDECVDLLQEAESQSTETFSVVARWNNLQRKRKEYDRCLGIPFLWHVGGNGRVYPCAPLIGDDEYCMGDLNENRLEEIIQSERMWEVIRHLAQERDVHSECPCSCRQDYLNSFLWQLTHPPRHVNFI